MALQRSGFLALLVLMGVLVQSAFQQQKSGHAWFDAALKRHVREGLVDYVAIGKDRDFQKYLTWLANVDTSSLQTREEAMAFWINAYNALAIKGVLDHYPLQQVIKVPGFFTKQKHRVAGGEYTLDEIEKAIIFPRFQDPKLHFVLVCAALSCPNLPASAYTAANLTQQMETVTRAFLNNPKKNRLDKKRKIFYLSQIFNWYRKDFGGETKTVLQFIKPYLDKDTQAFLQANDVRIEYLPYDWTLNSRDAG